MVEFNRLSGNLSWKIGSLPNLRIFNATHNTLIGDIPFELFDSKSLETLDLSVNDIEGELSPRFQELETLRHLYLHENAFDGTIPIELGGVDLVSLKLHGNFLSGDMPVDICAKRGPNLKDLQILTADCGEISGSKIVCDLPDCCTMCM